MKSCARRSAAIALLLSSGAMAQTAPDIGVDSTDIDYPVVITPTRLRQSLADVPASITVVTAETLRHYGIANIPDALRLVPGMAVLRSTGNEYGINYHGTYASSPRRLNVLIDGTSLYRPGLSRVEWAQLPVAMEDVDHIEVIRGPDSAAYGPNSMMAVINILTKHPKEVERGSVSLSVGSHGVVETTVRLATTLGPTSLRATASTLGDGGYDRITLWGNGHDRTTLQRLSLRSQTDLSDGASLDLQASYVNGMLESPFDDAAQISYSDQHKRDMQVSVKWGKALSANHEVEVTAFSASNSNKQSWSTCWPLVAFLPELRTLFTANPAYGIALSSGQMPSGGSAQDDALVQQALQAAAALGPAAGTLSCGQANQDRVETRTQLEVQDTYVFSNQLRLVAGLGARVQDVDSQTYFGGKVRSHVRWAFGHAEYRPTPWLTANVGGYAEANSLSGHTFSPRLALNAHLSDTQTLRAVFSQGTRSPDLFEEQSRWTYTLTGLSPSVFGSSTAMLPFVFAGNPALVNERIVSRELGYLLVLRRIGLTFDAKLFDDHLTHLIPAGAFGFGNEGGVRLSGAEAQANWDFLPGWSGMLSHAYLINHGAINPVETQQYARHSGSIGITHAFSDAWRGSLAYYGASGDGLNESRYQRMDLTMSHAFKAGSMPGSASLVLSYLDTPSATTNISTSAHSSGVFTSSYQRRLGLRGTVRLAF